MKNAKTLAVVFLLSTLMLIGLLLSGCGSRTKNESYATMSSTADYAPEFGYDMMVEEEYKSEYVENDSVSMEAETITLSDAVESERKLTYTVRVRMETKTYRDSLQELEDQVASFGGYISHSNVEDYGDDEEKTYSRFASYTIRIPSESLDRFLDALDTFGSVRSTEKQVNDITVSYYDTQSRLNSLKEQEQRLIDLQKDATLSEVLEIEGYLSNVRYEIEYLNEMMQVYERDIALSTIHLELSEVLDYTVVPEENPGFFEQIGRTFGASFEVLGDGARGFVMVIIFLLPFLFVFGVIAAAIVIPIRIATKKKRAKQLPPAPPIAQPDNPNRAE